MQVSSKEVAISTDAYLILEARKGDSKAFNQLVGLWYNRIYNYLNKQCGNDDMASELAQKTFISVFRNLDSLKDTGRFKSWVYRIATNFYLEEARKQQKNRMISIHKGKENDEESDALSANYDQIDSNTPERGLVEKEVGELLEEALQELNEDYRSVVIMKEYEGLKFKEIADALNESENTVKSRLYRGLKQLKELLEKKNMTKEFLYYEL